jgi:glycosyltransferase involved in cell wall biosynthesis
VNVCIVTAASEWGGAEMHTVALARTLAERHHRVSMVQIGPNVYEKSELARDVRIRLIETKIARCPGSPRWLDCFTVLRAERGDICIFAKGSPFLSGSRLDFLARALFARFLTIEHGECPPMPAKSVTRHFGGILPGTGLWWWRIFLKRSLRLATPHRMVCVSRAIREQLIRSYRFRNEKAIVVHDGVDTGRFRPSAEFRHEARALWRVPESAFVFGMVGRLSWEKNHLLAVDLFGRLAAAMPERDLRLVIAGEGPECERIRDAAERSGLGDRITLAGFTDRPWEIYPAFDALLLTSRNEGLSLVLLEAMSSGCCPIAIGVGGVPEIVRPGLGWLVSPGDEPGLVKAMRSAAESDATVLSGMGRRAREHVITYFNKEVQLAKLVGLVESECLKAKHHAYR